MHLLGRGDGLYLASDASEPVRIQGYYSDDQELEALIERWRSKAYETADQTDPSSRSAVRHAKTETGETSLGEHEKASLSDELNSTTENDINDKQVESLTWNEVWPIVIELFHQTSQMERINMKTTKDAARSLGASIGREVWPGGTWRDITAAPGAQAHQKEDTQKEAQTGVNGKW